MDQPLLQWERKRPRQKVAAPRTPFRLNPQRRLLLLLKSACLRQLLPSPLPLQLPQEHPREELH